MIVIVDNDVILKIARWDLLDDLVSVARVPRENVHHLPTCKWVLCYPNAPHKAIRRCGDSATVGRILDFLKATPEIVQQADVDLIESLKNVPGIDAGELLIFAVGAREPNSVTFIGDKRSLIALNEAISSGLIPPILTGRARCLEQVVADMISEVGFQKIAIQVRSCIAADKTMAIVFGTTDQRSSAEIWDGLFSYFRHLRGLTGDLLANFPEEPALISRERQTGLAASPAV